MIHLIASGATPLEYVSSGNLISQDGFLHRRRNLDTFVLLFGIKGTLYITQGENNLTLSPNTYLILFPGMEHYGTSPSHGELSYFWCHFRLRSETDLYIQTTELMQLITTRGRHKEGDAWDVYFLSESGSLREPGRVELLFHQVLDIAREPAHSPYETHYALSLLMMEISNQFYLAARNESFQRSKPSMRIYEVLEWLRTNFAQTCSLQELATRFSYHPTYLSAAFKRESGIALVPYITKLRIAAAKEMLLKSEMLVAEIAEACGFTDDKHFMKVFKAHEYTTPTQYRYSFDRRRVNKE